MRCGRMQLGRVNTSAGRPTVTPAPRNPRLRGRLVSTTLLYSTNSFLINFSPRIVLTYPTLFQFVLCYFEVSRTGEKSGVKYLRQKMRLMLLSG